MQFCCMMHTEAKEEQQKDTMIFVLRKGNAEQCNKNCEKYIIKLKKLIKYCIICDGCII